jgi:hypothetical protein
VQRDVDFLNANPVIIAIHRESSRNRRPLTMCGIAAQFSARQASEIWRRVRSSLSPKMVNARGRQSPSLIEDPRHSQMVSAERPHKALERVRRWRRSSSVPGHVRRSMLQRLGIGELLLKFGPAESGATPRSNIRVCGSPCGNAQPACFPPPSDSRPRPDCHRSNRRCRQVTQHAHSSARSASTAPYPIRSRSNPV